TEQPVGPRRERSQAMTKRRLLVLGSVLLVLLFIGFLFQCELIGWWRGEAKYKGRYTNSWRAELRQYHRGFNWSSLRREYWTYSPVSTRWERLLAKVLPTRRSLIVQFDPPLQEGDAQGIPVLLELLRAPEPNVRALAARGLGEIGSAACSAVPALLSSLNDASGEVALEAAAALYAIDKASLAAVGLGDGKWASYRASSDDD